MQPTSPQPPAWMRWALIAAGAYNSTWGTLVCLIPQQMYDLNGLSEPPVGQPLVNRQIWQCLGMVLALYGVAYFIASTNPMRHWGLVLVGFLGKVLGPVGMFLGNLSSEMPWDAWRMNVFNDLIWWVPFGLILYHRFRHWNHAELKSQ